MASKYSAADYTFQFITVTVGMFIALFINGMVEWKQTRDLVAEARATLAREIADNKKDLEGTRGNFPRDLEELASAVTFADDMLKVHKTKITAINLHYNMADLSDSSWRTAERTGALSHMEYAEVQKYSKLYDFQDLFLQNQRAALSQLTIASSLIGPGFDPDHPNPKDLETFRERVLGLRATIVIQQDLASKLAKNYEDALK